VINAASSGMIFAIALGLCLGGSARGGPATRPAEHSFQYGAQRLDFDLDGQKAFLIRAPQPASDGSQPWIWYAPTFASKLPSDRHAWLMTQLLAKGFSIAGVDVGESYGSPRGRQTYQALYEALTTEFRLAPKACLLPQSRGGLMLYNWAVEHADKVQCIGGIYPVCDLESYPGLKLAAPAYGMTEAQLHDHLAKHNPIDRLKPLAERKVKILHLHGDNDQIVPLDRNSGVLIARYKALGGPGELEVLHGEGHHEVDAFFHSQRLVDFFIAQIPHAPAK
jgi:alpha-beta hydrolase superfamily lysophospholipase